jgi:ABC-2 type transport system ATP-binding protein
VLGYDVVANPEGVKRGLGYMTQSFSLYTDLSVEENLRFHAGIHGLPGGKHSPLVQRQLDRFELTPRRKQVVSALSGGWRQRVALACSTIHDPKLLFLDEPTAGVDPVSRRDFWQAIHGIAGDGTTVLVTTHYMDEAEHCNRLAFIFSGRLLQIGTPTEIVERSGLRVAAAECRNPIATARALSADPAVVEASVHGERLRLTVHAPSTPQAIAESCLAQTDLSVPSFVDERTTVEDAFVAQVRHVGGAT